MGNFRCSSWYRLSCRLSCYGGQVAILVTRILVRALIYRLLVVAFLARQIWNFELKRRREFDTVLLKSSPCTLIMIYPTLMVLPLGSALLYGRRMPHRTKDIIMVRGLVRVTRDKIAKTPWRLV